MEVNVCHQINDFGICSECPSAMSSETLQITGRERHICLPFRRTILNYKQCIECKVYLINKKSEVYCSDCKNNGDYPDWGCDLGNRQETSIVDCKDKEK